jgi:hypothetical protein
METIVAQLACVFDPREAEGWGHPAADGMAGQRRSITAVSAEALAANPEFVLTLRHLARDLRAIHDENPRMARSLASHQRWLLTQSAFALHLEYNPAEPSSGLTAARLKRMITPFKSASRNTVLNFLDQGASYRFIRHAGAPAGKRPRRYETTEISDRAMLRWFTANLIALDYLDGGDRAAQLMADPAIFRLAQPRAARACLDDVNWREPPERVALFLWTEAGGLVMDEMIARIEINEGDTIDIGRIDARSMATHFMMSRTHLQRLLRKAVDQGSIGWIDDVKKTQMWLSRGFLDEYCRWQAVKFAWVDEAFHWARDQIFGLSGAAH